MIERLLDVISDLWEYLTPVSVIDQTEQGIVKRLGIYQRTLQPGLHFKLPLLETIESETTVITTLGLNSQTLTTLDNKSVVISAIIKYHIEDVALYLLKVYDSEDVLADTTMGEIKKQVTKTAYQDLSTVERKILPKVRRSVKEYGVMVHAVTFIDIGAVKSIRLIQDASE